MIQAKESLIGEIQDIQSISGTLSISIIKETPKLQGPQQ